MNPLYKRLEATAKRLIKRYGKAAELVREEQSGPAHNPAFTTVRHPATLVETGYSLTNRNETLIQAGDKVGIISTAGETPLKSDKIEIDGALFNFVDLAPLNPGGLKLLYEFQARR